MNFIKSFSKMINEQFQMVILAVLSVVAIYTNVMNESGFLDVFVSLLPILFILIAVWLLVIKKNFLESYIVIFLFVFSNGIITFVRWLLSYHFALEEFAVEFSFNFIFLLLGCIYLMIMIASYLMTQGLKIKLNPLGMLPILLLYGLYTYVANGILSFILVGIYLLLAFNVSDKLSALAIMLAFVITIPFEIISLFVDDVAKWTTIYDWVIDLFGLVMIGLLVFEVIKYFEKKEPKAIE